MSRKFSVWLPTTIATPCCAGSMMLWPPSRHQAAANESDVSKRVKCRKFADSIDQQNSAAKRFAFPLRAPGEWEFHLPQKIVHFVEALRMPRRQQHHCSRVGGEHIGECAQKQRLLLFNGASADKHRSCI